MKKFLKAWNFAYLLDGRLYYCHATNAWYYKYVSVRNTNSICPKCELIKDFGI